MTAPAPLRCRRGSTAVEFALCAAVLTTVTMAVLDLGVLTWADAALQGVAAQTARCVALASALCGSATQYAVTLAQQRLFSGVISASNVVIAAATSCGAATGQYTQVTITSNAWLGTLAPPFGDIVLSVHSCYPVHP